MCGKGGSPTTSVMNQNQNVAYTPAGLQQMQEIWNRANAAANQPYTPYGGPMVQGLSPQQIQAMENLGYAQGTAAPYAQQGAGMIGQGADIAQGGLGNFGAGTNIAQGGLGNLGMGTGIAQGGLGNLSLGTDVAQSGLANYGLGTDIAQGGLGNFGLGTNVASQGQEALGSAYGLGLQGAQGVGSINSGDINRYMNPFQSDVINATMGNIRETNAQQQQQVMGNAAMRGALGGDRMGVAQAELARQQALASNQTLAGLNQQNYQQAVQTAQSQQQNQQLNQQRALAAAGQMGALGSQYGGLGGQLAGIGSQYGNIGSQIAGIGSQVSNTGSQLAGIGSQYGNIGSQVAGIGSQYGNIGSQVAGIGSQYGNLGTQIGGLGSQYGNMGLGLQSGQVSAANALLGAGGISQQTGQNMLNAGYQQYLQQQAFPYQQAQFLASIGLPAAGGMGGAQFQIGQSGQTITPPGLGWLQGLIGAGAIGGGIGSKGLGGSGSGGMNYSQPGMNYTQPGTQFAKTGGRIEHFDGGGPARPVARGNMYPGQQSAGGYGGMSERFGGSGMKGGYGFNPQMMSMGPMGGFGGYGGYSGYGGGMKGMGYSPYGYGGGMKGMGGYQPQYFQQYYQPPSYQPHQWGPDSWQQGGSNGNMYPRSSPPHLGSQPWMQDGSTMYTPPGPASSPPAMGPMPGEVPTIPAQPPRPPSSPPAQGLMPGEIPVTPPAQIPPTGGLEPQPQPQPFWNGNPQDSPPPPPQPNPIGGFGGFGGDGGGGVSGFGGWAYADGGSVDDSLDTAFPTVEHIATPSRHSFDLGQPIRQPQESGGNPIGDILKAATMIIPLLKSGGRAYARGGDAEEENPFLIPLFKPSSKTFIPDMSGKIETPQSQIKPIPMPAPPQIQAQKPTTIADMVKTGTDAAKGLQGLRKGADKINDWFKPGEMDDATKQFVDQRDALDPLSDMSSGLDDPSLFTDEIPSFARGGDTSEDNPFSVDDYAAPADDLSQREIPLAKAKWGNSYYYPMTEEPPADPSGSTPIKDAKLPENFFGRHSHADEIRNIGEAAAAANKESNPLPIANAGDSFADRFSPAQDNPFKPPPAPTQQAAAPVAQASPATQASPLPHIGMQSAQAPLPPPPATPMPQPRPAIPAQAASAPAAQPTRFSPANPPMTPDQVRQEVMFAANKYGVPMKIALKQINRESGFKPFIRGAAGEEGPGQIMPGTAKQLGIDPRNPYQNIHGSMRLMSQLHDKYGDWGLALAAYNAGPGAVDNYLAGKRDLPSTTKNYIAGVLGGGTGELSARSDAGAGSRAGNRNPETMSSADILNPQNFTANQPQRRTIGQMFRDPDFLIRAGLNILSADPTHGGLAAAASGLTGTIGTYDKFSNENLSAQQKAQELAYKLKTEGDKYSKMTPYQEKYLGIAAERMAQGKYTPFNYLDADGKSRVGRFNGKDGTFTDIITGQPADPHRIVGKGTGPQSTTSMAAQALSLAKDDPAYIADRIGTLNKHRRAFGLPPLVSIPPVPADKSQLIVGQVYETSKGMATWDGTKFISP